MDIGVIAAAGRRRVRAGGSPSGSPRRLDESGGVVSRPAALWSHRSRRSRRLDESGGVVSLWVVLMVPVSAFAAVVAMAGPQRMAAESSMREAAHDLAAMAVAERYVHQESIGQLTAFPLDCNPTKLEDLKTEEQAKRLARDAAQSATPYDQAAFDSAVTAHRDTKAELDKFQSRFYACELLEKSIVRDLGNLGVDMGSLRGFYSDSLTESTQKGKCFDTSTSPHTLRPSLTDRAQCEGAGHEWFPGLCQISEKLVVQDAVHVALAADWQDAGWAAAQVWPDGRRLGAEAIGRRARAAAPGSLNNPKVPDDPCDDDLDMLDSFGRPVVLKDQSPPSRQLSERSGTRTPLSG